MKYNQILTKTINKYNNISFKNAVLVEGVSDLVKYFPKLSKEDLQELVALDPTYKGGEQLGKYGKWIIRLFYNTLKNVEAKKQYQQLLKQYPDGINPKTGQKFQEPTYLPSINCEDLAKMTNSIKQYDLYKKEIGKPIDAFKTLPELDQAISSIKNQGVPTNELALKRYNLFKSAEKKGLKKIYEDKDWIVGIPTTKESSVMFGSDTSWCTTSQGQYYERYSSQGDLFILLNKDDGKLYQFHFETGQFMNEHDSSIDMYDFVENYPTVSEFLKKYMEKIKTDNSPETEANKIIHNQALLNGFFEDLQDANVNGEYVTGELYLGDISSGDYAVLSASGRDEISFKFIEEILSGDSFDSLYYDYDLDSAFNDLINYNEYPKFDEILEPLGFSLENAQDLLENDGELINTESPLDENTLQEIYELLQEPEYDIVLIYNRAMENGSYNDCYKDIVETLKDNLPLDDENPLADDATVNIKFPVKEIKNIIEKIREDYAYYHNTDGEPAWYEQYNNSDIDYTDENNWLYVWRQLHYDYADFSITEPYSGWNDFDKELFDEEMTPVIEKIKEIIEK